MRAFARRCNRGHVNFRLSGAVSIDKGPLFHAARARRAASATILVDDIGPLRLGAGDIFLHLPELVGRMPLPIGHFGDDAQWIAGTI